MSYLDTTIVAEAGYGNVNYRQVYDAIAGQMIAHAQWDLVDTVDYVTGANTYRTHVWRNNAATSGLSKDFHVAFRYRFTTIGTVYFTLTASSPHSGLQIFLFEDYDSGTKTASKIPPGSSYASVVVQSDNTHPMTWALTGEPPSATGSSPAFGHIGPVDSAVPSYRLFVGVTTGVIYLASATLVNRVQQVYVGAIDSALPLALDPIPLVVFCGDNNYSGVGNYGYAPSTRHPALTGAADYVFGHSPGRYHNENSPVLGGGAELYCASTTNAGVLGNPANLNWPKWQGGPIMSRSMIWTAGQASGSTRGGLRGYFRHVVTGQTASHTAGDTLLVDGKAHLGLGGSYQMYGLWDTTA